MLPTHVLSLWDQLPSTARRPDSTGAGGGVGLKGPKPATEGAGRPSLIPGPFPRRLSGNSIYLRHHLRWGDPLGGSLLLRGLHRVLHVRLSATRPRGPRLALGRLQRQHRLRSPLRPGVRGFRGEGPGPALPHEPSQQRGGPNGERAGGVAGMCAGANLLLGE